MEYKIFQDSEFKFYKSLGLIFVFFLITPLIILTSLFALYSLPKPLKNEKPNNKIAPSINTLQSGVSVYASLPSSLPTITSSIETADAREEIIRQYLKSYHSPLEPFAKTIIEESDKNSLDYRLLTAIAQQESNLCKVIPANSYNCWGWGIHSKGSLGFSSYDEAIVTVASGLKESYIDKGLTSIEEIMSKYTPLSEGSWALGVNSFMEEMETPF